MHHAEHSRVPGILLRSFLLLGLIALATPTFGQQARQPQGAAAANLGQAEATHWPVALRWWGQAFVTVETWWGITVAIDPYGEIGYEDPDVSADLVLTTHNHQDHSNTGLVKGNPTVFTGLTEGGDVRELRVAVDRKPNEDSPRAGEVEELGELSEHAVTAFTVPSFHDDKEGAERGRNALWVIEADGVRILHMGDFGQQELGSEQLAKIGKIDLLLIPVGGTYTVDGPAAAKIVEQVKPRIVIPIHYKTEPLSIDLATADAFVEALPESFQRQQPKGNTVAVSAGGGGPSRVVTPDYRPWEMPAELAELYETKEEVQKACAEVYRSLNASQMNFRPSNGTHTPRWNVEHTNGYELSMFSAFFSATDPEIARINERPEQMPPDYVPANPEWTGAEEARQIERTAAFSRRFAYLLDGKGLDATAEGARVPLGRMFEVMGNHYNEHTDNVKKKFDLPDWPKE